MSAKDQLVLVREAIADILKNGQENEHGDRRIVRARLDYLMNHAKELEAQAALEEAQPHTKRNKIRYFEPL